MNLKNIKTPWRRSDSSDKGASGPVRIWTPVFAFLLLAAFVFGFTVMVGSASAQETSPASVHNPKPDEGDVVLPMPCGLSMVFRAVAVPAKKLLDDQFLQHGYAGQNADGFVDRPHQLFMGSSLSPENLPENQRQAATAGLGEGLEGSQIYLIGKYEVSVGQWQAVMEGCSAIGEWASLPKTGLSYFDANRFIHDYMLHLLAEGREHLPSFLNDPLYLGYLRLPTEAEWEYAARGGHKFEQAVLNDSGLTVLAEPESAAGTAAFSAEGAERTGPLPIGSLKPGPSSLHDMAGNVAEMTLDSFKMTVGGRFHGSEGGFLVKGGSYKDSLAGIQPGRRRELPLFTKNGPVVGDDIGFRLVLSGVNTTVSSKNEQLKKEFSELRPDLAAEASELAEAGQVTAVQSPEDTRRLLAMESRDRIEKVLSGITDPGQRKALESLLNELSTYEQQKAEYTASEVRSLCRSLIYVVYSIRYTSLQRNRAYKGVLDAQAIIEEDEKALAKASAAERSRLTENIAAQKEAIVRLKALHVELEGSIRTQFNYYLGLLQDISQFDPNLVLAQNSLVRQEFTADDRHTVSMQLAYDKVTKRDVEYVAARRLDLVKLENVALPQPR